MLTTFDRYVLSRLLYTFVVFFIAAFGLYIVIDLFTNVDDFQGHDRSAADVAIAIASHYGYGTSEFFELAGPSLIVVSAIAVLGLMEKHSESHPILAAGIPASRLLYPLLLGGVVLNVLLMINQEFIMPGIAVELQMPRGSQGRTTQKVEPVYDYFNYLMHIDGDQVVIEERKLVNATFNLPQELAGEMTYAIRAENAIYMPEDEKHPAGWLLKNISGIFDPSLLTDLGRERIFAKTNGKDLFIVSDVSFDQLYNRGRNLKLLSSMQLIHRIRNPATGMMPLQNQSVALHSRVTRPLLSLLAIAIALPLVMRRESPGLIVNMTICTVVLGFFYGIAQGSLMLGSLGTIRPDMAAWFPVMVTGGASVWTWGYVQT